jgi:hypothetical protein
MSGTLRTISLIIAACLTGAADEAARTFEAPTKFDLVFAEPGATPTIRSADRYDLAAPSKCAADHYEAVLKRAFKKVEAEFGAFNEGTQIEICVPLRISYRGKTESCAVGLHWSDATGASHIAVVPENFTDEKGTAIHELTHDRLSQLGANLPWWLEEGVCHYMQAPNGENAYYLKILKELKEYLSYEDLEYSRDTDCEYVARAIGYAVVRHWVKVDGYRVADVTWVHDFDELWPSVDDAVAEVVKDPPK